MNELATIDPKREAKLAAMLGSGGGGEDDGRLPQLRINYQDEDDQERPLKKGLFFVTNQDEAVYASKVKIRVLAQFFQYKHWDNKAEKYVNNTILMRNMRQEPIDEKGTVRCGKPKTSVIRDMPEDKQEAWWRDVKCYRQLYVLVSYTGTTADGDEVTVENLPALFSNKGDAYNAFEDQVQSAMPRKRNLYDFWVDVETEKKKNSSVIYWVPKYSADFSDIVPPSEELIDTMEHIATLIEEENERVRSKHRSAMREANLVDDAIEAVSTNYTTLEDDLEDDVDPAA